LPENAAFIESLLAGAEQTPEEEARREIVVINASAALVAAGAAGGFREGAELADKALREGMPRASWTRFAVSAKGKLPGLPCTITHRPRRSFCPLFFRGI
jgi:anthranilate phosphoribosyltransferase